jgi:leucyl-tRNA synthetase
MGFDSFGLPAENYAIKNKVHPSVAVEKNIARYKKQLEMFGFTYDWDRQVITSDPEYYKWTQWIFLQMFNKGLAYESNEPINWCPKCLTGLANEDVEDGKCERCGTLVEKKPMRQWVLKITDYAERLLDDLDPPTGGVNWEKSIVDQQINWIGRSEGTLIRFELKTKNEKLKSKVEIFTTRPDTLFGATFMVICPEHELITKLKTEIENLKDIEDYIKKTKNKSELERTDLAKDKSGVEIKGIKAINPANNEEIPIFVADYVLPNYGTGAIMAVPAHDVRDNEFAKKHNLPIKKVIEPKFVTTSGDGAVRDGLPLIKREAICAIVRNPKDDTYLCISWKNHHMHGLITGGIDSDEDIVESALREIHEETGYKNLKLVKDPDIQINTIFYQRVKKENRWARFHYLIFDLINDEKDPISEKESSIHDIIWKKKSELNEFLTVSEGTFSVNIINSDEYIHTDEGILVNSGEFDGMDSEKAKDEITKFVNGKKTIQYKLKDWVFSRQRYWGEPFPLVFCENCAEKLKTKNSKLKTNEFSNGELTNPGWIVVPEDQLPIKLPDIESYEPTGTGESPLAAINEWVNTTCPKCGGKAKRETNTMPQWAGSSWYYLAYTQGAKNLKLKTKNENIDKDAINYWMQPNGVDLYVGGAEHATRHLIYARFWHKFLYDINVVSTKEPFYKLQHVGLINGDDGRKMSKRWGNVINPDDVINEYGADALRCYEMFMGPFADSIAWSTQGVKGTYRFLEKVYNLLDKFQKTNNKPQINSKKQSANWRTNLKSDNILVNQTIKKVTDNINDFKFNTAISALMILVNEMTQKSSDFSLSDFIILILLLSPFAPHLSEELWTVIGNDSSLLNSSWPQFDEKYLVSNELTIPVQINGKIRATINITLDLAENDVINIAKEQENVKKYLENAEIKKTVYISGKIISFVI